MKRKQQLEKIALEGGGDGKPGQAGIAIFRKDWLSQYNIDLGQCFLIWVDGTGMEPALEDSAPVLVDRRRAELVDDDIFMVRIGDGYVVGRAGKSRGKWRLHRDAPGSESLDLSPDDTVIGQVVWTGKTLLREDQQYIAIPYMTMEAAESAYETRRTRKAKKSKAPK